MMGGVKTDLWGRTSLPGLYAAGETADTGVHGANRLASNSLLEGLVFGARSGQAMMKDAPVTKRHAVGLPGSPAPKPGNSLGAANSGAKPAANNQPSPAAFDTIRDVTWRQVGIMRDGKELAGALAQLQAIELTRSEKPGRAEYELRNLHSLALLMARSALAREESRGSHYRADFPYRDDEKFNKHSIVQKGKDVGFQS
jgi:L-aspartate oxidase